VVVARSVGGAVVSTVSKGTSATNKPRVGRFRITHGSARCAAGQIPIPPEDPMSNRCLLVSRLVPPPSGCTHTVRSTAPGLGPRGEPPLRCPAVMVATAATCPHQDTCLGQRSATIRNLEATCPRVGTPLGEDANDRPRFFNS